MPVKIRLSLGAFRSKAGPKRFDVAEAVDVLRALIKATLESDTPGGVYVEVSQNTCVSSDIGIFSF